MDAARATGVARFKVLFEDPDLRARAVAADRRRLPGAGEVVQRGRRPQPCSNGSADAAGTRYDQAVHRSACSGSSAAAGERCASSSPNCARPRPPAATAAGWTCTAGPAATANAARPLERVWIADLRRALESQFEELLGPQAPPDDPRWDAVAGRDRADQPGAAARPAAGPGGAAGGDREPGQGLARPVPRVPNSCWPGWTDSQQRVAGSCCRRSPSGDDDGASSSCPALADETQAAAAGRAAGPARHAGVPGRPGHAGDGPRMGDPVHRPCSTTWPTAGTSPAWLPRRSGPEALILEADRDPVDVVLRRTAALLADLKRTPAGRPVWRSWKRSWPSCRRPTRRSTCSDAEARFALFADACRVRRQIAFRNPLLNFDELLFIKRHRSLYNHMCDQYYGMAATPGGGLYVLSRARSARTRRSRDVLANSVVERGRLQGPEAQRRPEHSAAAVLRRRRQRARPGRTRAARSSRPTCRTTADDPLRLRRVPGRPAAPAPHRSDPGPLGRGPLLPRLQGQRRRHAAWSS